MDELTMLQVYVRKEIRKLEKLQTKHQSISNAVLGGGMGALMEVNKKINKIKARREAVR